MKSALCALTGIFLLICLHADSMAQQATRFEVFEASISQLQDALSSGKVT